jgi:mannose-6-phosphate isomerase-like protein (cupin superfamily)
MKVRIDEIEGEIVKDNETYVLEDNNFLEHMTLSRTFLKPGQSTRGHSHENQEEVYIFTEGNAIMVIGDDEFEAIQGDTFLIKAGKFHRVINKSEIHPCAFTCIFEKYDRSGDEVIY